MATSGSVDVNLDNIKDIINNSTSTAAQVTGGIADQGDLIGLAVGVSLAILLLIGAVAATFGFIWVILNAVRKLKGEGRRM